MFVIKPAQGRRIVVTRFGAFQGLRLLSSMQVRTAAVHAVAPTERYALGQQLWDVPVPRWAGQKAMDLHGAGYDLMVMAPQVLRQADTLGHVRHQVRVQDNRDLYCESCQRVIATWRPGPQHTSKQPARSLSGAA